MKNFADTKKLLNDSSLFYYLSTAMDGTYAYVNNHYNTEFAHVSNNLVGQPYHITMHQDDVQTCIEVAEKCFENPTKLFPATIRKHDGKGGYVYTQWEYKAMLDDQNNPLGILCLGYNITKFVGEQSLLKKANEVIEKNSLAMKNINFQQSHLIRAPLSNIIGLTQIIDKSLLDTNTSNICEMILESSKQLDNVIRSIITISKT